ncbi:MAG: Uma2 family endonuclease [Anaerolineales bacterium]|nr:Uma2 family endonuclease [Anaerolineales bacterium]
MKIDTMTITAEQFDAFVRLPENVERLFEYIGGEIVEVLSNPFASKVSQMIAGELYIFLKGKDLGLLTGEAGGYVVYGERYAPDVAYISKVKQPELAHEGYNPNPPDLAVEVDYPPSYQSARNLMNKVANYLAAGTVVWVVYPDTQSVDVFEPSKPAKTLTTDGVLDGGAVLPGFQLAVKEIFPPTPKTEG